jgi:hypothetical protein
MEGKIGVVATGREPINTAQTRYRLAPRRYAATFGTAEQVGNLTYAAAHALGGEEAQEQVVLGDGAEWIKTQAAWHFPASRTILDWPHAARALHKAIRAARPGPRQRAVRKDLHQRLSELLWTGQVAATLEELRALRPASGEEVPRLEETITYLEQQREWLGDYAAWQAAGVPVGSGLVERAVEVVINRRLKRRGGRWWRRNADGMVALRVRRLNAAWEAATAQRPVVSGARRPDQGQAPGALQQRIRDHWADAVAA